MSLLTRNVRIIKWPTCNFACKTVDSVVHADYYSAIMKLEFIAVISWT